MKKILFVMNTMGHAGAEMALIELLKKIDVSKYDISLFVVTGQGEMVSRLPNGVKLLNKTYNDSPVLNSEGRKYLRKTVLRSLFRRANVLRLFPYLVLNFCRMLIKGRIKVDKLLWRVLSDGADRIEENFDLAVAYLEGASAYYVTDHVKADKKAAFIHVDYDMAGYTGHLDRDCYLQFDNIFAVSEAVRQSFLLHYPACAEKTAVFRNIVDADAIREKSLLDGGFKDSCQVLRVLTVGRLTEPKGLDVSINACRRLIDSGENFRWYVLGEGDQRALLEKYIHEAGMERYFILLGADDNPYTYMRQADIYVQCSRYEGSGIALREAQILGKPVLATNRGGLVEQVKDGENGLLCEFSEEAIADKLKILLHDEEMRKKLGTEAVNSYMKSEKDIDLFFALL